jgi:hypothetical protein
MEMDRQTIIVLFGVIIAMTLFGTMYLGSPSRDDVARPTYAQEDIRSKIHQEEVKKKKVKKSAAPRVESSNDNSSDDDAEEPPAEEPSAEEPSIE